MEWKTEVFLDGKTVFSHVMVRAVMIKLACTVNHLMCVQETITIGLMHVYFDIALQIIMRQNIV